MTTKENVFGRRRRAHLVGIGGAGMNGIAQALHAGGHRVTGSDLAEGATVAALRAAGVGVALGHAAAHVPEDADLVVVSAAIADSNPELVEARRRGLPVLKYAAALGCLMDGRRGIAVAGAHGKTTTTGLLAFCLDRLGADPTFVVGGNVKPLGGSSRVGSGPFLVAEACEYDRSFLNLRPEVGIVTNIDEDHLDYYSGIGEITEAFLDFARLLPADGLLVALNELSGVFGEGSGLEVPVTTVGLGGWADWVGSELELAGAVTRFSVRHHGRDVGRMATRLSGTHNVLNCLFVVAVATHLGFAADDVRRAILEFPGVTRRLELKFRRGGITVLDDYAHHPAEIRATLTSIRELNPGGRLWCVFQPHQASRTRFLIREFAAALSGADRVLLPDIYFARDSEEERRRISSLDLVKKVMNLGTRAAYVPDFEEIVDVLLENLRPRDVLVTMGAGDIFRVADAVAARLEGYGRASIPA